MKREEKNFISLQRILDTATQEFARQGYGLSSVNTICNSGGISKGILYHYFKDKDALYLACLQTCFDRLTAALREGAADLQAPPASAWNLTLTHGWLSLKRIPSCFLFFARPSFRRPLICRMPFRKSKRSLTR